jgi:hypothetical protein
MADIKNETPAEVEAQIAYVKEKIADPDTPPAHKAFFAAALKLLLSWLPVIIDIFHHMTGTPSGSVEIPGVPVPPTDENPPA